MYFDGLSEQQSAVLPLLPSAHLLVCLIAPVSSERAPSPWFRALKTFTGDSHLSPVPAPVCQPVHSSPCTREMEAALS